MTSGIELTAEQERLSWRLYRKAFRELCADRQKVINRLALLELGEHDNKT